MISGFSRRSLLAASGGLALLLAAGCTSKEAGNVQENAANETVATETDGPAYVLITQPVGKTAPADYAAQLSAARKSGTISDVVLVKSKPSEEGPIGFDTLAVVEFPNGAAYDKWIASDAPKLGQDLVVRRADLLVDDRAKSTGANPAYVVSHYEALVPADAYTKYTKDYITPNMDGQKAGGVLAGYAMYYEREPTPGWTGNRTILVKQYVDEAAFGRSGPVKAKDKVELLKNPEWKKINDTKETIRKDISGTLALPIALP